MRLGRRKILRQEDGFERLLRGVVTLETDPFERWLHSLVEVVLRRFQVALRLLKPSSALRALPCKKRLLNHWRCHDNVTYIRWLRCHLCVRATRFQHSRLWLMCRNLYQDIFRKATTSHEPHYAILL